MKRIERVPVERVRVGDLVKAPESRAFYQLTRAEEVGDGEFLTGTGWGSLTLPVGTVVEVERRIPEAPFETLGEVERLNASAGQHFFDRETLAFFKSRICQDYELMFRRFFLTTEKDGSNPRRASIRFVEDDGSIQSVGDFQQFKSPAAAATALEKAIAEGVEVRNDPYPDVTDPTSPEQFNWRCYVGELPIGPRTSKSDAELQALWLGAPVGEPVSDEDQGEADPLDALRADCGYDPQDFEGRGDALMDYKDALEDRCAQLEQAAAGKRGAVDRLLTDLGLEPDDAARETVTAWLGQPTGGVYPLSREAFRLLCGLVHPSDVIDSDQVIGSEAAWQEIREMFPVAYASTFEDPELDEPGEGQS